MAYADDLTAARENLAAELKNETARRKRMTDAGMEPPTTYTIKKANGVMDSYDWNGYLQVMLANLKTLDELATQEAEPFELPMRGWT